MLGGKFALTGRVNCEVCRPPFFFILDCLLRRIQGQLLCGTPLLCSSKKCCPHKSMCIVFRHKYVRKKTRQVLLILLTRTPNGLS